MQFDPFAPELPVTACADPRPFFCCDIISFNGQGQLCPLTCAEWRDLSNYTRMNTIQSRIVEKKVENLVTLTWKLSWKSFSTSHLPFLSSNPKILKALPKTFPTKMKSNKCPAKEKKWGKKKRKKRGGEKAKSKSQDCCVACKPKNYVIIIFCFLRMPKPPKLILICIWIRRPCSVWPVNCFLVSLSSL